MFNNFLGKGIKKFANIFWKNGVSTLDIGKDPNILNNLNTGSKSSTGTDNCLNDYDYNSICNKDAIGSNPIGPSSKILPISWNDKEKKKDENTLNLPDLKNSKSLKNSLGKVFQKYFERLDQSSKSSPDAIAPEIQNELRRNILKNRVCEVHINANNPREDRTNAIQLKNFDGYFLSVLDGHGGDDVAEFANRELHKKFDEKYKELAYDDKIKEKDKVKMAIAYAFAEIVRKIKLQIFFKFLKKQFLKISCQFYKILRIFYFLTILNLLGK
jgi:hypothetical protein